MSLPQVFHNAGKDVRAMVIDGKPFFVAKDVCDLLGYTNSSKAVSDHCKEKGVTKRYTLTDGGEQELTYLSEGNVVRLITRSKKAEAEQIEEWIFDEVIPQILKTGSYQTPSPSIELSKIEILQLALESEKQRMALEVKVQELAPKARFADSVSNAIDSVSIADFAKAIGTGEIRMFKWLRDRGFLFKEGRHNKPYQKYIEQGLFKLIEKTFTDENGEDRTYFRVLITGKGQIKLAEEYKKAA